MRESKRSVMGCVLGVAAVVLLAAGAIADDAVSLRYQWAKGEVQHMRMTFDVSSDSKTSMGPMSTKQKQVIDSTMTAKTVDEDGTATLEVVYDRIRMDMDMNGKKTSFDSSVPAAEGDKMMGDMLSKLVGVKLTMVMTPTGEVKDVRGMEKMFDDAGPTGTQMKQTFGPDGFKKLYQSNAYLPTDPVKPGATWKRSRTVEAPIVGKLDCASESTFTGMEVKNGVSTARISLTTEMATHPLKDGEKASASLPGMEMVLKDGKGDGDCWFDAAKGRLVKMVMRQTMVMDMTMTLGEKKETMSQSPKTVTTMEIVEDEKGAAGEKGK